MSVRRLKKSYRNVTGFFFSRKLGRLIQFDSMLERDFILLLDLHPSVRSFTEQPMKVPWLDDEGSWRVYVPDFLIEFSGTVFLGRGIWRPWIVELKYRNDLKENWKSIRPKLRGGVTEAVRRQLAFHVITEDFLSCPPSVNAFFLKRFVNCAQDLATQRLLCQALSSLRESTPRALVSTIATNATDVSSYMQEVWTLIARGVIAADMEKELTTMSTIRLATP